MFTEHLLCCRQGANPFRCVTSFKEQNLIREVSSQNIDKEMDQQPKTPANQASGGHSELSGLDPQIILRATTHLQRFKATKATGFFCLFVFNHYCQQVLLIKINPLQSLKGSGAWARISCTIFKTSIVKSPHCSERKQQIWNRNHHSS